MPPARLSLRALEALVSDRLAIVSALEAIDAGELDYAVEILLGALEDGDTLRPYRCRCGAAFQWPGELDAHRIAVHEAAA
jgi:hypothetical protein